MYEIIESLQELDELYYIDFIPYETSDVHFLELEEYFETTYLPLYAEKISRIALKLIYFFHSEIYLTESSRPVEMEYEIFFDVNIRHSSPDKLAYIIKKIVSLDFSSVQILFSEPQFLMSINGGFSVNFYGPTDEVVQLLQKLVSQEGLFLKYRNSTGVKLLT
ncbi:hypothetical protein SAMN05443270_0429 [Lacrimispora sphenoides]|jgi:hypothetical protein|uniref:hypothetical protein n=1 Tax=Lacrimispora sphenoides TaxID=29370 RepID=UPI0008C5B254|nr:hypothetical protein [Lacrimispora sphenoides]SET54302.1 hypothetical protein SAMN05443270_0429 [Lacrimispora sphenoides]